MNLSPASHEGDIRFTFGVHPDPNLPDHGLAGYYAMHSLMSDYDGWETDGKPTATTTVNGSEWALAFDYSDSGLDPWENPNFEIENVKEFRFYFVAKDSPHYSGAPADQDDRVKGGTITVRPRWPDLTSDGEPVSVPQYGAPYMDVQVQASNVPFESYQYLVGRIFDAFDISASYADHPHPDSHINDLARYVRIERGKSGGLIAADGPIARSHKLISGDRDGYRKHEENHSKIPGYKVTSIFEDTMADTLVRGHELGKELKHYYPKHPDQFEPDQAPYHPKFEVSYQTKRTEKTVRYSELEDTVRELDETLLNCLDWAGIAPRKNAGVFVDFDPYWTVADSTESRKLVDCPLPEIEDEQEHRVMRLWGNMTDSDRDVTEMLLADGGEVSPQKAAEETGNSYRTVREVVSRLDGLIKHTYGELQIESKNIQQELQKRVRAAGERFEQEIGSSVMDLADAAADQTRSRWHRARRRYSVTIDDNPNDSRKRLKVGYKPQDKNEANEIISRLKALYKQSVESNLFGVSLVIETLENGRLKFENLEGYSARGYDRDGYIREEINHQKARENFNFDKWMKAGCPPRDEYSPE